MDALYTEETMSAERLLFAKYLFPLIVAMMAVAQVAVTTSVMQITGIV